MNVVNYRLDKGATTASLLKNTLLVCLLLVVLEHEGQRQKTNGMTKPKAPYAHLQLVIARNDCAANGPMKAVAMKGVVANPKAKALFFRPDVSATKTSRMK